MMFSMEAYKHMRRDILNCIMSGFVVKHETIVQSINGIVHCLIESLEIITDIYVIWISILTIGAGKQTVNIMPSIIG